MLASAALSLLVVDDDDVASEAVARGLKRHDLDCPIIMAEDGLTALQILRGEHPSLKITRPHLVLLDLNMPRMSGLEFLRALRSDLQLCGTVVFVLSTSGAEHDRAGAYREGIAGYLLKSGLGPHLSGLARLLIEYRQTVVLP
jgi:CheY-like chemotaxis protein